MKCYFKVIEYCLQGLSSVYHLNLYAEYKVYEWNLLWLLSKVIKLYYCNCSVLFNCKFNDMNCTKTSLMTLVV